mmetsp:Transcript_31950/g.97536  ORF Transcript_31950/g.97536 Transcript_31950/m.97536 type:complete len:89 (-) Transcript_31950:76-342(-)|eukprot:scaffold26659_cov35-Tisochrysis_lutea.AAC.4
MQVACLPLLEAMNGKHHKYIKHTACCFDLFVGFRNLYMAGDISSPVSMTPSQTANSVAISCAASTSSARHLAALSGSAASASFIFSVP